MTTVNTAMTSSPFCIALLELHPPSIPSIRTKKKKNQIQYPASDDSLLWRIRRIVLHTTGSGAPEYCASLIDRVCPQLVQRRRDAALNQQRAITVEELTTVEKSFEPLHGIVKGSTLLATRHCGHTNTHNSIKAVRATFSIFYDGALALVCLDSQQNAFPSSRIVDYGVNMVRTCLATLPSKYNQLVDRIEKKYSEIWFLLKRTLITQERSAWFATKRLVAMTLCGRGPLHHRSSLRALSNSIPNDVAYDFSSDIWQDSNEDSGPSRWLDIKMNLVDEESSSHSTEYIGAAMSRMSQLNKLRKSNSDGDSNVTSSDSSSSKSMTASFVLRPLDQDSLDGAAPRTARSESTLWGSERSNSIGSDWGDEKMNVNEEQSTSFGESYNNFTPTKNLQESETKLTTESVKTTPIIPAAPATPVTNGWGFEDASNDIDSNVNDSFGDFDEFEFSSSPVAPNALSTIIEDDSDGEDEDSKDFSSGIKAPTVIQIKNIKPSNSSISNATSTTIKSDQSLSKFVNNFVDVTASSSLATLSPNSSSPSTISSSHSSPSNFSPSNSSLSNSSKKVSKPIVMNGEIKSLLTEEITVKHHPTDSKVLTVVVRGKLEVRAKTLASKDKNVRLACFIHVNKVMPMKSIKFKVNGHHMREKNTNLNSSSSPSSSPASSAAAIAAIAANAASSSFSSSSMYQCVVPGHPSNKKAIKIMQYVTKEYRNKFIQPLQQHLKITPNILIDYRIDPSTNESIIRVAYRIKITKNPAIDWRLMDVQKIKFVAVFKKSKLPNKCKLLCKPKATFMEKDKTLTWKISTINKKKTYLDAMFTIPSSYKELNDASTENIKPELMVQFQVVCKSPNKNNDNNKSINDGGTNTNITIQPAKLHANVKGSMQRKLLCKYLY
jgi:hypothetical protein